MTIGVPKEIKAGEKRIALTPAGVLTLTREGHAVLVETGAGTGSGLDDAQFEASGAKVVASAEEVWRQADLVLKVKEPLTSEYPVLREEVVLFTYLHLAACPELTRALMAAGVTAVGYETVQDEDGGLPLLVPMSEVAGRMAVQVGAWLLETVNGGRGVLLGGVPGVSPAEVVVLGAGVVGTNAAKIAAGMGAHVTVLDIDPRRLRYLDDVMHGRVTTLHSHVANIERMVEVADLVIGCVLVPGAPAPRLVTEAMVGEMKPGAAIVDVAVDQGGCVETIRVTSHDEPTYMQHGVVHYGVPNMPGAVPHTSTWALTDVTLPYVSKLAGLGLRRAIEEDIALARGVNVQDGRVVHPGVAESLGG